jgi:peptidoglycan/LPS O-acetylase OafA/YrhL
MNRRALVSAGSHVPALDGLRGLAILLVLTHHLLLYGGMEPTVRLDRWVRAVGLAGWIGVDLFFVLSGFLITGILADTCESRHYFRNFYARRVLRIFPLYYGFLALYSLVLPLLVPAVEEFRIPAKEQLWYWTYLVNVRVALYSWPPNFTITHFWSLAIEEQFYLLWPLVVVLIPRRGLMRLCVLIAAGSLALRTVLALNGYPLAAFMLMPSRIDALALGAFLALAARGRRGIERFAPWATSVGWLAAASFLGIVVIAGTLDNENTLIVTIGLTTLAAGFAALLVGVIRSQANTRTSRLFNAGILIFFGQYSYALYVVHQPVIMVLRRHGFSASDVPTVAGSQLPGELLFAAVAMGISMAAALLSWKVVESPFLRFKRRFPYEVEEVKAAPEPFHVGLAGPRRANR